MPAAVLEQVGTRGFTQGKEHGTGIGVHHARQTLESIGGGLEISSIEGSGTSIVITVPLITDIRGVLIDDDVFVREAWSLSAKKRGLNVLTLESSSTLKEIESALAKDTPIYVDVYLDGEDGVELAGDLHQRGFSNLYLATGLEGFSPFESNKPDFVRGIVGKDFPL